MTFAQSQIDSSTAAPAPKPASKPKGLTFAQMNLAEPIAKAITACGYVDPTPVQQRAIPEVLKGSDVVACAQTGTGKTAAFVLPALHRLSLQQVARKPRILILTPTRELASQITTAAIKYGKFLRFNMASLVGGMSYRQQLKELSRSVDMIVATPGRLLDHMENRRLDLSGIEMLILDEADRMLDMGFIDDVQAIAKATPASRQTLLFSATVEGKLSQVVKNLLKSPVHIDLSQERVSPTQIKQELYYSDNPQHKARLLQHFLNNENIFKAIIFSATKIGADKLAGQLCNQGYLAAPLHGDLKQSMRNRTLEQLRRGKIQFLVATDVAARGIDIVDMTHVINYDLPRFCEDYVHRIGRTGRAGKTGVAISFALPSDMRHVASIEKYIGTRLESLVIPGLEPTHKPRAVAAGAPPRKRGGKSSGGFGKSGGYSRSEGGRSGGYGKSEGGRSSHGKSERAPFRSEKSPYAQADERKSSGFARSEKRPYGKSTEGKTGGFSRPERPEFNRSEKRTFGKSEDRPSFGRSDKPRTGRPDEGKSGFGRSDRSDSNRSEKPRYGKSTEGRTGGFARPERSGAGRSDEARPSFGRSEKRTFGKPSEAKSGFGRSEKPRYGKADDTKSGFGRSERSNSGYTKSFSSKSSDGESTSARSDNPKISYAKKSARPAGSKLGVSKSSFGKGKATGGRARSKTQKD